MKKFCLVAIVTWLCATASLAADLPFTLGELEAAVDLRPRTVTVRLDAGARAARVEVAPVAGELEITDENNALVLGGGRE